MGRQQSSQALLGMLYLKLDPIYAPPSEPGQSPVEQGGPVQGQPAAAEELGLEARAVRLRVPALASQLCLWPREEKSAFCACL